MVIPLNHGPAEAIGQPSWEATLSGGIRDGVKLALINETAVREATLSGGTRDGVDGGGGVVAYGGG